MAFLFFFLKVKKKKRAADIMRRKVGEKETQSNRGRYKRTQNRQEFVRGI